MNQSNALRRTAITFGLAVVFALLSLIIQNSNQKIIEKDNVEASVGNTQGRALIKN